MWSARFDPALRQAGHLDLDFLATEKEESQDWAKAIRDRKGVWMVILAEELRERALRAWDLLAHAI